MGDGTFCGHVSLGHCCWWEEQKGGRPHKYLVGQCVVQDTSSGLFLGLDLGRKRLVLLDPSAPSTVGLCVEGFLELLLRDHAAFSGARDGMPEGRSLGSLAEWLGS